MSGRPIVLPDSPRFTGYADGRRVFDVEDLRAYARAAVEADRRGIVVTDEDVEAAWDEANKHAHRTIRAALEACAKRLRGETP